MNKNIDCFVLDGNPFSTYCLLAPLSSMERIQEELKDVLAFVLFYSDKHIQAGLPVGSVLGDTVRRLIISLIRFPKVRNIMFLEIDKIGDENKDVDNIKNTIKRIFECIKEIFKKGEISNDLVKRCRIKQYHSKILEFIRESKSIKFKFYRFNNFKALIDRYEIIKNEIYNNFELPPRYNISYLPINFKPLSSTINAYSKLSEEDLFTIKVFDKVSDAYDYCINVVKYFGLLYWDGNYIRRYQVKMPYVTIALKKWDDLKEFLIETGIYTEIKEEEKKEKEYKKEFKEKYENSFVLIGNFTKNLRTKNLHKLKEYIDFLKSVVESGRYNFSRDLDFVSEKEASSGLIQVGWSKVKTCAYEEKNMITFDFHHILRSVDVHNGLPYNIYYCIKLSDYIVNTIKRDTNKKIKIGKIFISLGNLHSYFDNLLK